FRDAFMTRYEGREVPLLEALDGEVGIGFALAAAGAADASPLLRGLPFPATGEETTAWGARERVLLRRLGAALARGERQIVLSEKDLEELAAKTPPTLPDSFAVMATLVRSNEGRRTEDGGGAPPGTSSSVLRPPSVPHAGEGFWVILEGASGPSGARLLGRFCHADARLREEVEAYLRAEDALRPGAIFAEIVHLPEGRVGNVLL